MSNRLAILIGNGRFDEDPSLPALFGPRHDVTSLGRLLSDPGIGNYDVLEILEHDSKELLGELQRFVGAAGPRANLLLYYAGCIVSEPGRGLFIATSDTRLDAVKDTAVSFATVKSLLRRCAARDVTVIFDCCYVGPAGGVDEADVEHELRRVRIDVSSDLHVFASPAKTLSANEREAATGRGLEGRMTRAIIDGLATGAADRDGDNTTKVSELNEYLGLRLGERRPLWAGPLGGRDPAIVANPHPIEGIDPGRSRAPSRQRLGMPRWALVALVMLVIVGAVAGTAWLSRGGEARTVVYLREIHRGPEMPDSVGLVDDLESLRRLIYRTGWVEHTEPLDGAGPRYPEAARFRLDPGNSSPPGTVDLGLRQWAQVEFGEGIHALGVRCGPGQNVGEALVELINGDRYLIDLRADEADGEFFGVVSRVPINRLRITSTSMRFAAETLYVYADREYPRPPEKVP